MKKEEESLRALSLESDQLQGTSLQEANSELLPWTEQPISRPKSTFSSKTRYPRRRILNFTKSSQEAHVLRKNSVASPHPPLRVVPFAFTYTPHRTIHYCSPKLFSFRNPSNVEKVPSAKPRPKSRAESHPAPSPSVVPRRKRRIRLNDIFQLPLLN